MTDISNILVSGRIMYPHVHEPHQFPAGRDGKVDDPAYMASIVLAKDSPAVKVLMDAAAEVATEAFKMADWNMLKGPLRTDVDNPLLADHYFIRTATKYKPSVLYMNKTPVVDPSVPADGDWCHFSIRLFSWSNSGNRGVSAGLNGVVWQAAGPHKIGKNAGPTDDEMFGKLDGFGVDAPAAKAEAPNLFGV